MIDNWTDVSFGDLLAFLIKLAVASVLLGIVLVCLLLVGAMGVVVLQVLFA